MKRHRFDPFSFLFGALFLTVGCSFLFGSAGATAVRPFRSWPAAIVVAGLVLVAWAVARAACPAAVAEGAVPGGDATPPGEGSPKEEPVPASAPALFEGESFEDSREHEPGEGGS